MLPQPESLRKGNPSAGATTGHHTVGLPSTSLRGFMITAEMSRAAPCQSAVSMVVQQSFKFCFIITSNQTKNACVVFLGGWWRGQEGVKEFSCVKIWKTSKKRHECHVPRLVVTHTFARSTLLDLCKTAVNTRLIANQLFEMSSIQGCLNAPR